MAYDISYCILGFKDCGMATLPGYSIQKRPEMIEFVPVRRARVLEIGCAEGDFLATVPGIKEAWGIEPSSAAQVARGRLHRVFQATFDEVETELPASYFDVIICNDVIEHMPDHDAFFSKISRCMAPGGMIIGSIPNVRFYQNLFQLLFEKDWDYTDAGILDRTHLRFFTEKSFRKCLRRHGMILNRFQGLTTNIGRSGSPRERIYRGIAHMLACATFGYFSDIRYLQFAFQASLHAAHPAALRVG